MPRILSLHWDEVNGVCTKHWLPATPCCQQCMEEQEPDIEVRFTETEMLELEFDHNLKARDFLPEKYADWLVKRVRAPATYY